MEAIILAGGFGTRLKSVINDCPKPMAPINGRPFLEILLQNLSKKGFKRVILSLHYQSEKIRNHFKESFLGIELDYAIEHYPLGTGGAIMNSFRKITKDHVYVLNGDTFIDLNFYDIEKQWAKYQSNIVILKKIDDIRRYGCVKIDGSFIKSFSEKEKDGAGLINAGIYVLRKDLFSNKKFEDNFSFEKDFLTKEVINNKIQHFISDDFFIDIGIPEDYKKAQLLLN